MLHFYFFVLIHALFFAPAVDKPNNLSSKELQKVYKTLISLSNKKISRANTHCELFESAKHDEHSENPDLNYPRVTVGDFLTHYLMSSTLKDSGNIRTNFNCERNNNKILCYLNYGFKRTRSYPGSSLHLKFEYVKNRIPMKTIECSQTP